MGNLVPQLPFRPLWQQVGTLQQLPVHQLSLRHDVLLREHLLFFLQDDYLPRWSVQMGNLVLLLPFRPLWQQVGTHQQLPVHQLSLGHEVLLREHLF